jgi:hypothetical protein
MAQMLNTLHHRACPAVRHSKLPPVHTRRNRDIAFARLRQSSSAPS